MPLEAGDFERPVAHQIEQSEFLALTKLDELRPDNNIEISEPGRYT
ncbi:MAG: hypothetical protein R3A10_01160 [Caldilineaceae bacterium]